MTQTLSPSPVATGTWNADPAHSRVEFRIKHMKFATVTGRFTSSSATLTSDESGARISGQLDIASATTYDADRDVHIQSSDFFDAERYPHAVFEGAFIDTATIEGELTLKGVTKPITLKAHADGPTEDPWGNQRIGIELVGIINRNDYGIKWNAPLPKGGFLLDDAVTIEASFSMILSTEQG